METPLYAVFLQGLTQIGALAHCCCSKWTPSAKPTSRFPNIRPLKTCRYASAPPLNSQDKQTCLEALKHNKHFTQTQHSSHPAYCTHLMEKHVTSCMYFVHNCVVNNCCRIQLQQEITAAVCQNQSHSKQQADPMIFVLLYITVTQAAVALQLSVQTPIWHPFG